MKLTKIKHNRWRVVLPCLGVAISLPGMPRLPAWRATDSRWIFDLSLLRQKLRFVNNPLTRGRYNSGSSNEPKGANV